MFTGSLALRSDAHTSRAQLNRLTNTDPNPLLVIKSVIVAHVTTITDWWK